MRGAFDDEEEYRASRPILIPAYEAERASRDAELTLGAGTLLLLFCGLVVLCGVCFGAGYMVGHHRTQPQVAATDQTGAADQAATVATSNQSKPSASSAPAAQPSSTPAQTDAPAQSASGDQPQSAAAAVPVSSEQNAASGGSQVRPALPAQFPTQQAQSTATARPAFPASGQSAGGLMVQIAAISRAEDADVLVGALRKRGYAVNVRRDPSDNLIHVRVGPFATRDEANRWRMRLLNDGYNAVVQP